MEDILKITERDKTLDALQKIQLEGLKEVDRICRKHNIKYSLGGGTCLGQVRHGGFIPWDDDIDIDMTTENYEKFIKIAPLEIDNNRFFLRCRETDKKHLRTCSRLEIKGTKLGLKKWDKRKMKVGIFIDIFKWSYLPNNYILRKIVSSSLFYLRCIENWKMFNSYARKGNPKLKIPIIILAKIMPKKLVFFLEDRLAKCCGNKKTDWIIDDAIINGNHGGYPSKGIDEYEDVMFEGIKVMNKKNSHNFLSTIYGENYNEWLPPVSRISHHNWNRLNFGFYKEWFDLDEDYSKYLILKYNEEKLMHMKELSLEMADKVNEICKNNSLKYYIVGQDCYYKAFELDELGQYFRQPLKIAMPKEDYEKFLEICPNYLDNKYFLQNSKTDKNYKYQHSRIRLNYTGIRDAKIPKSIEEQINNGFFIKIIPLAQTSNNIKDRQKHIKSVRRLNSFINIKWKKNKIKNFLKGNIKFKIKYILLKFISFEKLISMLEKELNKYNTENSKYLIDASSYELGKVAFEKDIFNNGKKYNYNKYELIFPENLQKYIETVNNVKYINEMKKKQYIKNNFPKSYEDKYSKISKKEIKKIQKKFSNCYLNYFDLPEYQLSVLRYDEKEKRFLTNEEIFENKEIEGV